MPCRCRWTAGGLGAAAQGGEQAPLRPLRQALWPLRPRGGPAAVEGAGPRRGHGIRRGGGPRVRCPDHGVVVPQLPWARHGARHTRAFDDEVGASVDLVEPAELLGEPVVQGVETLGQRPGASLTPYTTAELKPAPRLPRRPPGHRAAPSAERAAMATDQTTQRNSKSCGRRRSATPWPASAGGQAISILDSPPPRNRPSPH
jgi:hypothetical protein